MNNLLNLFVTHKKASITSLFLLLLILIALPTKTLSPQQPKTEFIEETSLTPGKDFVIGQTMVKFRKDISQTVIDEKLRQYQARVIDRIDQLGVAVLEVPAGQEQVIVDRLTQDGLVAYADLNYIYEERLVPNDSQFGSLYGMQIIQAPQAWDITKGKGIIVANIESGGADLKHPDLASNVLTQTGAGPSAHGTHTSGTMAAVGNNGQGVIGVCPECKLIVINVNGYTDATASKAIVQAADQGAKVVNMSFGATAGGRVIIDAVQYAWDKGCIGVAASGNDNKNTLGGSPGSLPHVVDVAATNATDKKATFSNYHKDMTIAAPGDKILSTIPGNKYGNNSGTSMASPMVAGVVALIWSTSYGTSPQAVVDRLCSTADKITGTGTQWKCGRVNAFKAVQGGIAAAVTPTKAPVPTAAPVPTNAPVPTTAMLPTKPPVLVTSGQTQPPAVGPTFAAIGDCVTNANCPPTPEPTTIAFNPRTSTPNVSITPIQTDGQGSGLLQQIILLLIQLLQTLAGRR